MLALLASPAINSAFHHRFRPTEAEANKIARLIATLHDIVVNPVAAPGTATVAKRMLIGVLEGTKEMRFPSMIVPPITHVTSGRARKNNSEEQADAVFVRGTAKGPLIPALKNRSPLTTRARASSSPTFHAAFSHGARANVTPHLAERLTLTA